MNPSSSSNNSIPPWVMWQNSASTMNAGQNSTGVNGVPHPASAAPAPLPPYAAATAAALSSMGPAPPLAAAASYNPAASSYATAVAAAVSKSYDDSDDDDDLIMPWERHGWTPLEKSGKQKTPNRVRGELQRYIDACKADGTMTQTAIIEKMGVNSNTFRRFMNPKTYKDQWSATQNGTYWAAAKLLEQVKYEKEQAKLLAKLSGGKRKSAADTTATVGKKAKTATGTATKSKAQLRTEAMDLLQRINAVEGVPIRPVYDSCPQLVKKMKDFLARPGMTKVDFCLALGDVNSGSLAKFMAGKGQDQCGNVAYRQGYVFFEKLRILEGMPKSAARNKNEIDKPQGFSLEKARPAKYYINPALFGYGW